MAGTILVIDGVATNRIMLKTRLVTAFYDVIQLNTLAGLDQVMAHTRPDLILTATTLPDGNAATLRAQLRRQEQTASIPVIAIAPVGDAGARMAALASGIDDVLSQPLDDTYLLARIRNLIRARQAEDELRPRDGTSRALGFADPTPGFARPSEITLICADKVTSRRRVSQFRARVKDHVKGYSRNELNLALSQVPSADVIVLDLTAGIQETGLRILAELRARGATRHAALIVACPAESPSLAADALDMGADDVMPMGFCIDELTLRLAAQLRRKRRSDRLRDTVRYGLRAAVTDPMTGLYNRRYAMPFLEMVIRQSRETGLGFAVMLADLDHFKSVNDQFGHAAGDAVLVETARRLAAGMRPGDLLARVGGEEFLMILTGINSDDARNAAQSFCRRIGGRPIDVGHGVPGISTTISIGLACGPSDQSDDHSETASQMISMADEALYAAKDAGRNQVTLSTSAA